MSARPEVLLHVGLPKAASTFLQKEIFPRLTDVHVVGADHQDPLFRFGDDLIRHGPLTVDIEQRRPEIDAALQRIDRPHVLISREGFCGNFFNGFCGYRDIAGMLRAVFPGARVFLIVRRQDDFLESAYKQALHQGYSVGVNRFLGMRKGVPGARVRAVQTPAPVVDAANLRWDRMLAHYQDLFGADNVLALPFEAFVADRVAFLDRFYAFSGIAPHHPAPNATRRRNRGYSYPSALIARLLNRFLVRPWNPCGFIPEKPFYEFLDSRRDRGAPYRVLATVSRSLQLRAVLQKGLDRVVYLGRPMISRAKRAAVMSAHRDSNRRLGELMNSDLKEWGYY